MGLTPPPKVEKLQAALHTKAKGSPSYRFYALYDKLYRRDILQHAFNGCLANRGVAGVDGVTFEWIKAYGEEKWLDELAEELRQQGTVGRAYDAVNYHVTSRLRQWLCRKHKVRGLGYSRYPDRYLYQKLGLYQLRRYRRAVPNATV